MTPRGYHVYDPDKFKDGIKELLWPGRNRYNGCLKSEEECAENSDRLAEPIRQMADILRFFLIPLSCEKQTRCRIESAIANLLYDTPGLIGDFQDSPTNLRKHYRRYKGENPILCKVDSSLPTLGLPNQFWA